MSGFGERFRVAGYKVPKPLIEVDGKPIIQYVIEMFPGENDITFICNNSHLNEPKYRMEEILNKVAPESQIVSIAPHKLGPIHAVLQVLDHLDLNKPTVVNYADFTCDWDYRDFCRKVKQTGCDGAIPCYRGFHPHTLWSNYYAYVQENGMRASDIQEKQPFTDLPRNEFASSGTYYFKSGELMKRYFERCVTEDLRVSGEYYVSMAYKPMMQDKLNIQVYELAHFMQWGTPSDLEEYCYWSSIFRSACTDDDRYIPKHKGTLMLPMVGQGSRFKKEGYSIPKPLIPVCGQPMALQALMDLPQAERYRYILRKDMPYVDQLEEELRKKSINAEFAILDDMTDGQASSCVEGANGLEKDKPVTIAACDYGMIYDVNSLQKLINNDDVDVIVWAARGYPGAIRNPEMYGWIDASKSGVIRNISVKIPLSNPSKDPIVVGAFTFKKLGDFLISVEKMKARKALVNNEYYVDMTINDAIALGLNCVLFEIDHYVCWGTPNDLNTFKYWQACFNNWKYHPYHVENDRRCTQLS